MCVSVEIKPPSRSFASPQVYFNVTPSLYAPGSSTDELWRNSPALSPPGLDVQMKDESGYLDDDNNVYINNNNATSVTSSFNNKFATFTPAPAIHNNYTLSPQPDETTSSNLDVRLMTSQGHTTYERPIYVTREELLQTHSTDVVSATTSDGPVELLRSGTTAQHNFRL